MRLLTYYGGDVLRAGRLVGDGVVSLTSQLSAVGAPTDLDMLELIEAGPDLWRSLTHAAPGLDTAADAAIPLAEVRLAPPIRPRSIICGGANFNDHLDETHRERPSAVEFFLKSPTGVIAHGEPVRMDPRLSTKYDYEVELAVVIGVAARDVQPRAALDHVFGYTIINDVSIRDQQVIPWDAGRFQLRFGEGKSYRDSAPLGPWIVTADELADVSGLALRSRVAGRLRQRNTMANIIWDVADLISYYSQFMTLQPGTVIACGTPGGPALGSDVELGADPYQRSDGVERGAYVQPGDLVECEIEGIGVLANRYVIS